MRPVLFGVGDFYFMAYGVMVTLSYVLGIAYLVSQRGRMGLAKDQLWNLILTCIIGALIGGRLGSMIAYSDWDSARIFSGLIRFKGGFSFYHGFWVGALFGLIYCRAAKLPSWRAADFCAAAVALSHVPGRIGCLLTGCCYGKPSEGAWGLVFPTDWNSSIPEKWQGTVALHPTQVYEIVGNLLIFVVLHFVLMRYTVKGRLRRGGVFWAYVLGYALLRFVTEPLRGLDPGRFDMILSTGQWNAVLSAVGALVFFLWADRRRPSKT